MREWKSRIFVVEGDITDEDCDVIVNAGDAQEYELALAEVD